MWPWQALDVLGVSRADGRRAARRAYLKLIRVHRPERDREGFMRVREAWEALEGLGDDYWEEASQGAEVYALRPPEAEPELPADPEVRDLDGPVDAEGPDPVEAVPALEPLPEAAPDGPDAPEDPLAALGPLALDPLPDEDPGDGASREEPPPADPLASVGALDLDVADADPDAPGGSLEVDGIPEPSGGAPRDDGGPDPLADLQPLDLDGTEGNDRAVAAFELTASRLKAGEDAGAALVEALEDLALHPGPRFPDGADIARAIWLGLDPRRLDAVRRGVITGLESVIAARWTLRSEPDEALVDVLRAARELGSADATVHQEVRLAFLAWLWDADTEALRDRLWAFRGEEPAAARIAADWLQQHAPRFREAVGDVLGVERDLESEPFLSDDHGEPFLPPWDHPRSWWWVALAAAGIGVLTGPCLAGFVCLLLDGGARVYGALTRASRDPRRRLQLAAFDYGTTVVMFVAFVVGGVAWVVQAEDGLDTVIVPAPSVEDPADAVVKQVLQDLTSEALDAPLLPGLSRMDRAGRLLDVLCQDPQLAAWDCGRLREVLQDADAGDCADLAANLEAALADLPVGPTVQGSRASVGVVVSAIRDACPVETR